MLPVLTWSIAMEAPRQRAWPGDRDASYVILRLPFEVFKAIAESRQSLLLSKSNGASIG
jgi:hypothetical protein